MRVRTLLFVPGEIEKLETILDWVGLTPERVRTLLFVPGEIEKLETFLTG